MAAARDNDVCGVGVAYGSMVAGMLNLVVVAAADVVCCNGHLCNCWTLYNNLDIKPQFISSVRI